jgi:sulfur carrier protein
MDHADVTQVRVLDLIVNGERHSLLETTLDCALAELGYGDLKVATALNGNFVPAGRRAATVLQPGDRLEIVTPRQGG